jgi:hypothetical protein
MLLAEAQAEAVLLQDIQDAKQAEELVLLATVEQVVAVMEEIPK